MKAIIFDMDGVLLDTERVVIDCWKIVAAKYGIAGIEESLVECIGTTAPVTRQIMLSRYGEAFPFDRYREEADSIIMKRFEEGRIPAKPGAAELLSFLKEKKVPLALATSTRSGRAEKELREAGLRKYFDVLVGGEMVTASKPEPDIFLKTGAILGFPPSETAVIEDSFNGIRAAARAGMMPIMVPDVKKPDEEILSLAGAVYPSLADLLEAIRSGALPIL